MGALDLSSGPIRINLEDELEGELVGTTDYFFAKIGEAVPLKGDDSNFDPESLPSLPLVVSEHFRLIFVAHSSGFYVARTKDIIDSAKEFKEKGSGSPVQQLSLVDVSIGRVRILAVSTDNKTVAASVSSDIQFFSVDNFLNKEVKQSFSCSLNDSAIVKDMRWITTSENSYVVLSNTGDLYYGEADFPLKFVVDCVEAVDWGVKGTFVAVAKRNVLSILSVKFEELVSISLSFRSWIGDSAANYSIKVDSVRCIRPDSIIIGCFQLTEDGKEESYLLQVIRSRSGEITDGGSEFVVQSFSDIYQGLIDDIVPFGSGPYLLLTYLEQCQLAINANRKNTDQHIMLLGWSVEDDKREAVVVDIERDNWVPRIELQENGDDNLLLGLCIDKVSIYQKVEVQLGVEERTDLLPHCVLICLTLEGKLVIFHVASLAGSEVSPEVASGVLNDEDASMKLHVKEDSTFSHELQKQELDQASAVNENLKSNPFANPSQMTHTVDCTKHPAVGSVVNFQSPKSNVQQLVPDVDVRQETDSHNQCPPSEQQTNLGQKTAPHGSSMDSFMVTKHSAVPGSSSFNNLQETTAMTKVLRNSNSSWDSQRASQLLPSETFSFPKDSDVSSFSSSSYADGVGSRSQIYTRGATNVHGADVPGRAVGKPFLGQDVNHISPAISSASKPVQSGGQLTSIRAAAVQPFPSSPLSSTGNNTAGKSSLRKSHPSNEQHGTSFNPGISSSDLSKQFSNINEMTKELDLLLSSIEEAGGFRDACTRSLQSSIEEVEKGMDTLSKKCKIWTCQVDEHIEEVHYLLNKTIQVVARKIYMEGIYKQASDNRYWDLWNQQKLNSELELKRQHILNMNQDLTYQLIELERHFNALELNKFSQYGGSHIAHGSFQSRYGPSRHIQSLHSLHNAISSQLVAAENLSECLSKQMTALSLRSLSEEQKNVKELFETIGISYDASFGSPDTKGLLKTPLSKNLLFSDSTTNKDQSKRTKSSAMKSCEPETARRRRDSLDQSWTCFEPPKTIIKRMLLQELQKPKWNGSYISINEKVKTSIPEEPAPHQKDTRTPSIVFPASKVKSGILDSHLELEEGSEHSKAFNIGADNFRAPTQVSESKSHVLHKNRISAVPSWPASQLSPAMGHGHSTETPSLLIKSSEMPITNSKMTMATSSTMGNKFSSAFTPESWRNDFPSSESHSLTISAVSTSAQPTFSGSRESPSSSTIKASLALPLSSSVSSAAVPPAPVSLPLSRSLTSSNSSIDYNNTMSTSSASASLSLSNQASKHTVTSLPYPSSLNSTLPAVVSNLKTDVDAAADVVPRLNQPQNGESESKLGPSAKFSPANEQSSNNATSSALNVISVSQSEQPSDASMQLSTSFLGISSGKNGGSDVGISYEDEMEEEAPETSTTTELSLGSLGGFGNSSTPNPSMPKPNPFGVSFSNAATNLPSSTTTFSVPSGQLFRPASFTFSSPQSPAPAPSTNSGAFSGGFSAVTSVPAPTPSVFGQPAQIGSGQQVLGSVLGTFGQSRQLGSGLPGSGFAAPTGFAGSSPNSGLSSASTGGGFAGIGSNGGGFANIASAGGGFANMASAGGGFGGASSIGGGFAGAASTGGGFGAVSSTGGFAGAASGSGFGAFSSQGSGGFAAFGSSKPPELFTQMRK